MSVADHFYSTSEDGFLRKWDVNSARRQFKISIILIISLALAGLVIGRVLTKTPLIAASAAITSPTLAPENASLFGRLVSDEASARLP